MDAYLRELEQRLRLDPEETRAIVAEVRGSIEDLAAHLQTQGYQPDEALQEAVRRFDDAGGLARALRWAHRGAPRPLQALALLLVSAGLVGAMLGADAVLTASIALVRHTDTLLVDYGSAHALANTFIVGGVGWWLGNIIVAVELLGPGMGLLAAAGVSLWLARTVLFGIKRVRWRRIGIGAGIVGVADLVAGLALLGTIPRSAPRPVAVPDHVTLWNVGLGFRPAPDQPTGPVVVDRVFADRTATYVQFHIPDAARDGEPVPMLGDDRGRSYDIVSCTLCNGFSQSGSPGLAPGIQQLLPWRTSQQSMAEFAPLHSDAHEAVLQFGDYYGSPTLETVHVPVNLAPLRRLAGGTHPFIVVSAHGVRVNVTRVLRGLTGTMVDYTVDATPAVVPRRWFIGTFTADLLDVRGQPLATLPSPYGSRCLSVDHGGAHCAPEPMVPALPRGTRLTLVVRGFVVYSLQAWPTQQHRTVVGPWRITFAVP